jgi:hypothetical protein
MIGGRDTDDRRGGEGSSRSTPQSFRRCSRACTPRLRRRRNVDFTRSMAHIGATKASSHPSKCFRRLRVARRSRSMASARPTKAHSRPNGTPCSPNIARVSPTNPLHTPSLAQTSVTEAYVSACDTPSKADSAPIKPANRVGSARHAPHSVREAPPFAQLRFRTPRDAPSSRCKAPSSR